MNREEKKRESRSKLLLFLSIIPILACFLCYQNSLSGDFIWDDFVTVVNNRDIKSLSSIPNLFVQNYWGAGYEDGNYRPLTNLSFALNYFIGGLNPYGYHLFNLIFHALNGFLIYRLALLYLRSYFFALTSALIFVAHPVRTEAVSNISNRTELLATSFLLLSWLLFYYCSNKSLYKSASLLLFFLALLSKESAIVLPALLLLTDFCQDDITDYKAWLKEAFSKYFAYGLVGLLYLVIRIAVLKQLGIPDYWTFFYQESTTTRIFTMTQAIVEYFRLMVWPIDLCFDYDYSLIPKATTITVRVLLSTLLILSTFVTGLLFLRRERLLAFAILLFFITIAPVSNILIPTGILMADRTLYLPAISIGLIAAHLLDKFYKMERGRVPATILLIIVVTLLGVRTYYRNIDWRNNDNYSKAFIADAPNAVKARLMLASVKNQKGLYEQAEAEYIKAVELAPEKAITHGRLGEFYLTRNRPKEAERYLRRALELSQRHGNIFAAMGRLASSKGDYFAAIQHYRRAIDLSPPNHLLHNELGAVLLQVGEREAAVAEFHRAIELEPIFSEAYSNLGLALTGEGKLEEAAKAFENNLKLEPQNAATHNLLGAVLLRQQKFDQAITEFRLAIELNQNFVEAHNNLGVAYAQLQRFEDARKEFETVLRLNPNHQNAKRNLDSLN
ncbi:MAG: tetratricopeptide repeat protein [Blastocatellia bacterium]|nr:tetratricopeptide repeat protein [Blastocatellia bacterium]